MTDYTRLQGSSVQDLASSVKDFQTNIKKLKGIVSAGTDRDAFTRERDEAQVLSKKILHSLKQKPTKSSEQVHFNKLAREFEQLLTQFTEVTQSFIDKEKVAITLSQSEPQSVDSITEQRESFEFKYAGGLEDIGLAQREDEVRSLERDMLEINRMFNDVAKMVDDQGDDLNAVDSEVDVAVKETKQAVIEIDKAEGYQRSAKQKLMCILAIVTIVVAVIVVVVVLMVQ